MGQVMSSFIQSYLYRGTSSLQICLFAACLYQLFFYAALLHDVSKESHLPLRSVSTSDQSHHQTQYCLTPTCLSSSPLSLNIRPESPPDPILSNTHLFIYSFRSVLTSDQSHHQTQYCLTPTCLSSSPLSLNIRPESPPDPILSNTHLFIFLSAQSRHQTRVTTRPNNKLLSNTHLSIIFLYSSPPMIHSTLPDSTIVPKHRYASYHYLSSPMIRIRMWLWEKQWALGTSF